MVVSSFVYPTASRQFGHVHVPKCHVVIVAQFGRAQIVRAGGQRYPFG
jgi:hypothetical protein